jgi:hypothetical protein
MIASGPVFFRGWKMVEGRDGRDPSQVGKLDHMNPVTFGVTGRCCRL